MMELPEVRRADCGHGFLRMEVPPAAVIQNGQHQQPVYLCASCRAGLEQPTVEQKMIGPAAAETKALTPAQSVPAWTNGEPYELGRQALLDGKTEEDCPYADRRTKDAREWLKGFREAQEARG